MDSRRFDALAKSLATPRQSRRSALRRLGGGGVAALVGVFGAGRVAAQGASAGDCSQRGCRCNGGVQGTCDAGLTCCPDNPGLPGGPGHCGREGRCNPEDCTGEGCACHSGVLGACDDGLVCCADDPSMPGSHGRCETEEVCFGNQCQATTNPCPTACAAGSYCEGCCSGHCGEDGHCAGPSCTTVGCQCTSGVLGSCDEGLVCCQSQMGGGSMPGGPGMCATQDGCGG